MSNRFTAQRPGQGPADEENGAAGEPTRQPVANEVQQQPLSIVGLLLTLLKSPRAMGSVSLTFMYGRRRLKVLEPARDRIAHALRRGIEGELGKAGKKGPSTDGLKTIHDLALYLPGIFVPAVSSLVGPIIPCLLDLTLVIRNQACHALGGLALAASSLLPSEAHTRTPTAAAPRLTKSNENSPTTPSKKRVDASPSKDSVLSSARAFGCLAWRAMVWAFFWPPHVKVTVDAETDGEDESATEDDVVAEGRFALGILRFMSRKGGQTCKDAMDLTRHLLSAAPPTGLLLGEPWAADRGMSEAVPSEIREIWFHLLQCDVPMMLDREDDEGLAKLAVAARDVLLGILEDQTLNFAMRTEEFDEPTGSKGKGMDESPLPHSRRNFAVVKLFLVRDLLTLTRAAIPSELAESVLRYLHVREERLVGILGEYTSQGRRESEWEPEVRSALWEVFVERWDSNDTGESPSWETAVVLLSASFIGRSDWDMESDAIDMWDKLLRQAIDTALDHGIDSTTLIDQIAGVIATNHSPSSTAAVRVTDLLLSNVEIGKARQVPSEVLDFANDTLNAAYPPAPRHKVMCMCLIRTLTRVIDGCPLELCSSMLELIVEGMRTWVADEFDVCTADEYSCDILETLAPLLVAPFCGRTDKQAGTVNAFNEFWQATYAGVPVPPCGYHPQSRDVRAPSIPPPELECEHTSKCPGCYEVSVSGARRASEAAQAVGVAGRNAYDWPREQRLLGCAMANGVPYPGTAYSSVFTIAIGFQTYFFAWSDPELTIALGALPSRHITCVPVLVPASYIRFRVAVRINSSRRHTSNLSSLHVWGRRHAYRGLVSREECCRRLYSDSLEAPLRRLNETAVYFHDIARSRRRRSSGPSRSLFSTAGLSSPSCFVGLMAELMRIRGVVWRTPNQVDNVVSFAERYPLYQILGVRFSPSGPHINMYIAG
ncbi:hypothetical protein C8T65DRAFT_697051 [Cerioporus squamosus]|nr:hypothetical protein C8T65DRAFT_697051 [Cerioporus squamosus]